MYSIFIILLRSAILYVLFRLMIVIRVKFLVMSSLVSVLFWIASFGAVLYNNSLLFSVVMVVEVVVGLSISKFRFLVALLNTLIVIELDAVLMMVGTLSSCANWVIILVDCSVSCCELQEIISSFLLNIFLI